MRWSPRRNGGNNTQTRSLQSRESRIRDGHGAFGFAGHHSWAKGRGGGNKVGAITHGPKEWGSAARKEEEHLTMLAKQAELDAIAEGLVDDTLLEIEFDHIQRNLDAEAEYLLDLALTDDIPFVTVNGVPLLSDVPYDYDYYDGPSLCPCCGHRI